jgi:hypothetical protein
VGPLRPGIRDLAALQVSGQEIWHNLLLANVNYYRRGSSLSDPKIKFFRFTVDRTGIVIPAE